MVSSADTRTSKRDIRGGLMSYFFTADTHFGHSRIINYAKRPFDTVEEMDDVIISNWNVIVGPKDTVFHLGDFAFGTSAEVKRYRDRLNGKIRLIEGNHDKAYRWGPEVYSSFNRISRIDTIKFNGNHIVMCHYGMRVWDRSHFDTWHLYGHSHGNLPPIGKSWDVGVDVNKFRPLTESDIFDIMKSRPHNENYIEREDRR
jgi:calcineurin-like phosphoesterase family protein